MAGQGVTMTESETGRAGLEDRLVQPVFDSHFHVVDPRFPLIPNDGYLPDAFDVQAYLHATTELEVTGGAVVSGSFQGFDQSYLLAALAELGPGFVGVTQVPPDVDDDELRRLAGHGVRAVRFNLYRGGSASRDDLFALGRRAWDVAGLHVELYVDTADLPELETTLARLPMVSIDHLGMSATAWDTLLRMVETGVRVKATGFGRINHDTESALRDIFAVDPGALMFGTDLPGTRAPRPFTPDDITLIESTLGPDALPRVLHDNAMEFYRMS
jgi:predicted TIM-barrel fold metal-dependent hydrolase